MPSQRSPCRKLQIKLDQRGQVHWGGGTTCRSTRHAAKYIEHIKQQKKRTRAAASAATTAAAAEQQPQPSTSVRDTVCSKCQHKGHFARDCTAIFISTTGKFLGTGTPPPNHYWTKTNAANAKAAKKAAMVNLPPQQL